MSETISKPNAFRRLTDRLYGGINMSWIKVIILALGSAVVTALFLILPIFKDTSFREMGATFEAWVFLAIIIMVNCKKPLESALKTFVFFLISQPLIYLFQVPFSDMGWELFMYYKYWFFWTLLTFPMALAGWFLKKRNWISLLIITPINLMLVCIGMGFFTSRLIYDFPSHLITVVFCLGQVALYLYVFFRDWKKILVGAVVPGALVLYLVITGIIMQRVDVSVKMTLPDEPTLSAVAEISLEDSGFGSAKIIDAQEGYVEVHADKFSSTVMTVKDGDKVYKYDVTVYRENAHNQIDIKVRE